MSDSSARRILADVNLWLATIVEQHPHHRHSIAWWQRRVIATGSTVYLCRVTQLGVLRLLTNPQVMGAAVSDTSRAWQLTDAISAQAPVGYLPEPDELEPALRTFTATRGPWPGLWTDAYLAAFAQVAATRLATFDRGFRRFRGLDLELLG